MGMETADCFICRKHRGEIHVAGGCIYEDDYVYVGHIGSSGSAVYVGYVMVDLKRHVAGYGDMTEDEASAVGSVLNRIGKALKETEGAEHVYSFVQGMPFRISMFISFLVIPARRRNTGIPRASGAMRPLMEPRMRLKPCASG